MKKFLLAACSISLLLAVGCSSKKKEEPVSKVKTEEVKPSLPAYIGIYRGELPAASGPGIRTTLSLMPKNEYRLTMIYLGEKNADFVDVGKFKKDGDLITLMDKDGKETKYFQLINKGVRMLDQNKMPVKGDLAPYYILHKQN